MCGGKTGGVKLGLWILSIVFILGSWAYAELINGHVYHNGLDPWPYHGTHVFDDLGNQDNAGPTFTFESTPGYRSLFVGTIGAPQLYVPEAYLPEGGEFYIDLDTNPVFYVRDGGNTIYGPSIGQRFVAGNRNHIMGFHWAAGGGSGERTMDAISIHIGGLKGPQIGPTQYVHLQYIDIHHDTATWSAGEVPLLPGESYWLRIMGVEGPPTAWCDMSNPYPDGEVWHEAPNPDADLKAMISDEADGILTVFHNKITGWSGGEVVAKWAQTFVAYGDYVIAADFVPSVGDKPPDWKFYRVTIREGGPDGPQIGPEKIIGEVGYDQYTAAVWRPGEVPVVPGQVYALQVQQIYGFNFWMWHSPPNTWEDAYPNGTAYIYKNGQWQECNFDIKGCVVTVGHLPSINYSDIEVTDVTQNSVRLNWTSDAQSMCRVFYGESPEDLSHKWGPESGFSTSHSAQLVGLSPSTVYYYKVDGCAYYRNYTATDIMRFATKYEAVSPENFLQQGWNMIALPIKPDDPSPGSVFADLVAAGNTLEGNLYRYAPGAGYEVYPTDFTQLEMGRGYWLRIDNPAQANYWGERILEDAQIELENGWNMVGFPFPEPVLLSDCSITNGAETKSIDEAAAAGWINLPLYYYIPGAGYGSLTTGGGDDDSFRPWRAYWLLALQDGLSLIIPAP